MMAHPVTPARARGLREQAATTIRAMAVIYD
jgi:hypothetical protein